MSVNLQRDNEIQRLRQEVETLKTENRRLLDKLKSYNPDHFTRLKESIAICLNKAFSDIDSTPNNAVQDALKLQTSPMELLETVERFLFNFCGLAEQHLVSLRMQVAKANFELT